MRCPKCGSENIRMTATFGLGTTVIACMECNHSQTFAHNPAECLQNGHDLVWLFGEHFACNRCGLFARLKDTPEMAYFRQFSGE